MGSCSFTTFSLSQISLKWDGVRDGTINGLYCEELNKGTSDVYTGTSDVYTRKLEEVVNLISQL